MIGKAIENTTITIAMTTPTKIKTTTMTMITVTIVMASFFLCFYVFFFMFEVLTKVLRVGDRRANPVTIGYFFVIINKNSYSWPGTEGLEKY